MLTKTGLVHTGFLTDRPNSLPVVLTAQSRDVDPLSWVADSREKIESCLSQYGAVLFRGFDIPNAAAFRSFCMAVTEEILESSERAAPRVEISPRVYTSTEYPPEYPIPLHHENAFAYRWPMKVLFYCDTPASQGGKTPIADDQVFFRLLDAHVREEFRQKGVMYVRNYGIGIDMPWQEVFQTEVQADVTEYCDSAGMSCEWLSGNRLRTRRVSPAIISDPRSGKDLWFNHAHLFHISNLQPELRESLTGEFQEWDLPRNAFFGDGTSIDEGMLNHIRECYDQAAVCFEWQKNDVLLVDNMAIAHGREPFVGPRKILVVLADCSSKMNHAAVSA
ncbi:MAG TPA: TauD/TfdA family dioxygenase [Bryobacteraceae bacterium]|nr:TauD/TfdA family dioxygenase [Bryobacteraceae bacterium]